MDPLKQPSRQRPEAKIQKAIILALTARGWFVNSTHGNACQDGFPDLYCMHEQKGQRWIEVKNPDGWSLTEAQKLWYPRFIKCRIGLWFLMGATDDQLRLLDGPPNAETVLKRKYAGLK